LFLHAVYGVVSRRRRITRWRECAWKTYPSRQKGIYNLQQTYCCKSWGGPWKSRNRFYL